MRGAWCSASLASSACVAPGAPPRSEGPTAPAGRCAAEQTQRAWPPINGQQHYELKTWVQLCAHEYFCLWRAVHLSGGTSVTFKRLGRCLGYRDEKTAGCGLHGCGCYVLLPFVEHAIETCGMLVWPGCFTYLLRPAAALHPRCIWTHCPYHYHQSFVHAWVSMGYQRSVYINLTRIMGYEQAQHLLGLTHAVQVCTGIQQIGPLVFRLHMVYCGGNICSGATSLFAP
mmetsp:Transcript_16602/g.35915  ORF Transcript_16602/g.35915 Transcript_16602/m.35915 type:complete len:228 (-) Transcript_16602:204-887(-)